MRLLLFCQGETIGALLRPTKPPGREVFWNTSKYELRLVGPVDISFCDRTRTDWFRSI